MKYISLSIVALLVLGFTVVSWQPQPATGAAPSGLPATVRIMATTTVGPTVTKIFEASNCSSRIIRADDAFQFLPADGTGTTTAYLASTTMSATASLVQAASTTVVYDSGLWGCGEFYGRAAASTTITIIETR
jgi:hypothetical protein